MQNSRVESTKFPANSRWIPSKGLRKNGTPLVMGILNVTPDSFYDGSRSVLLNEILERTKKILEDGATLLDLGAYSSRPGADHVSEEEEIRRIVPVVKALRREFPSAFFSVDTFRAAVADAVLSEGANMINDISAGNIEPGLIDVVARHEAPYVLMHMRGTPQTMQQFTSYENLTVEVYQFLQDKIIELEAKGVREIIVDPGFGFSKTIEQNYDLLHHFDRFKDLNKPLLAGLSRKSMIYKKLGISPQEALPGTLALNAVALSRGADILRVHDIAEHVELLQLFS